MVRKFAAGSEPCRKTSPESGAISTQSVFVPPPSMPSTSFFARMMKPLYIHTPLPLKDRFHSLFRRACWTAFICWALAIIWLSSMPGEKLEPMMFDLRFFDKICHAIAFATGSAILAVALRYSTAWSWKKIVLLSILAVSIYGMTDEIHQLWTPGRSGADVFDWLADSAGATLGAIVIRSIYVQFRDPKSARASRQTAAGN